MKWKDLFLKISA